MLRSKVDPMLQFTSALFTCHVYLAILPLYKVLLPDMDYSSPDQLKLAREFVIEFIVNGFLITPVEAKP